MSEGVTRIKKGKDEVDFEEVTFISQWSGNITHSGAVSTHKYNLNKRIKQMYSLVYATAL